MSVPTKLTGKCPHCQQTIVIGSGQQRCSFCGKPLPKKLA